VVAARQELLNADVALTEGPGELRLGVKALDKLYEYWVFLTVVEQVRQMAGEPTPPGTAVLHRRLTGRKVRLELAPGTEVRFEGGITVAFSPTITSSGRGSWKSLELAGYHREAELRSPALITPDVVVSRESADGQVRLFVIDAKYRARHKVDPALNEIYLKYSRIRQAGRPVVAAVIAAHPHHDLDVRWPGQWSLPFVPGAESPPRFLPTSWMPHAVDTPIATVNAAADVVPDDTDSSIAQVLDRVFTPQGAPPLRSASEIRVRSNLTRSEAQSVAECAAWCRQQSSVTWRGIVERTLWRAANWELEATHEHAIPLGLFGQLFRALQNEVPWIDAKPKPLLEVVSTVLDEMQPQPGVMIETRRDTPHVVRSWTMLSSAPGAPPASGSSSDTKESPAEPDQPDLVVCDQQWMARARGGIVIDLARMRTELSGDACPTVLLASAAGRTMSFQHAAVTRGWLAFDHLDRAEMLERCRSILRHTMPANVTVVSGESDLIDLVGEYARHIRVETSLSRFALT